MVMKLKLQNVFLLLLIIPLVVIEAKAKDVRNCLVIWTKNGNQVAYALKEKPTITFNEKEMRIIGNTINVTYSLDQFARYTYENKETDGIKSIYTDKIMGKYDGENLFFPSLKSNSIVSIYTIRGVIILKKIIQEDGEYEFSLSSLKEGIYLVNVNGITFKIEKK